MTMTKVMTRETAEHFYRWLESAVFAEDQHGVEQAIHALLRDQPDLIDEGKSWPEIRRMAEF